MPSRWEKEETMNCKNCGQELADDEIICTHCGQDNRPEVEEEPKAGINPWKIAFPAVAGLCLLLVLSWLLYFGVTGYWFPRANTIHNKDSYTASEDRLLASRDSVVATLGKNKLTNAQLRVFYETTCSEYKGEYSSSKPLHEQIYDKEKGLTWQQYLLEMSINAWKQCQILTDMALEAGFELPEAYQKNLDDLQPTLESIADKGGYESVDAMLSKDICEGCTLADYKYYLELNYYAGLYFEELVADITVTREEIDQFYEDNKETFEENGITKDSGILVDYRQILVKADSTPDGITVEQWDICEKEADSILEQWLQKDPTEESFANLAVEKSDDKKTSANGGLCSYVYKDYLTAVDVRHILIVPEGGTKSEDGKTTVYSDEEWEACRKKAQTIYDQYLNGVQSEELFAALARENSKDSNAADGGIYTDVGKNTMVEEFDAWIFDESRQPGDTGLVKTQYGYHVMYFVHRDGDLDHWLFDAERKAGDYEILKSDEGYHLVYFVKGEDRWIWMSREALIDVKADELLLELDEQNEISVKYSKIRLGE